MKGISKNIIKSIVESMTKDDENDAESYRKNEHLLLPEIEIPYNKTPIITKCSDTEENHFTANKI